jgi:hypothetical protein
MLKNNRGKHINNAVVLMTTRGAFLNDRWRKLFGYTKGSDMPPLPVPLIFWDEYASDGGRKPENGCVKALRVMMEEPCKEIPFGRRLPFFVACSGMPIDRNVSEVLGFLSVICTPQDEDDPGDELGWLNDPEMMHSTPTNIRRLALDHEKIRREDGLQKFEDLTLLDQQRVLDLCRNVERSVHPFMIRRKAGDYWINGNKLLELPDLEVKVILTKQKDIYIAGMQDLAKPLDDAADKKYTADYRRWKQIGSPPDQKPQRGLHEKKYVHVMFGAGFPGWGNIYRDLHDSIDREGALKSGRIKDEGWSAKTLAELVDANVPFKTVGIRERGKAGGR